MSLVARALENDGIPTVVLGSARDVVEHCGVPRFLFTDFPLGNPCGHPWDPDEQRRIVRLAVELLETAQAPRTTLRAPVAWNRDATWKGRYARVDPARLAEYRRLGDERRAARDASRRDEAARSEPPKTPQTLGPGPQMD